jgi:hypothetical protein
MKASRTVSIFRWLQRAGWPVLDSTCLRPALFFDRAGARGNGGVDACRICCGLPFTQTIGSQTQS